MRKGRHTPVRPEQRGDPPFSAPLPDPRTWPAGFSHPWRTREGRGLGQKRHPRLQCPWGCPSHGASRAERGRFLSTEVSGHQPHSQNCLLGHPAPKAELQMAQSPLPPPLSHRLQPQRRGLWGPQVTMSGQAQDTLNPADPHVCAPKLGGMVLTSTRRSSPIFLETSEWPFLLLLYPVAEAWVPPSIFLKTQLSPYKPVSDDDTPPALRIHRE